MKTNTNFVLGFGSMVMLLAIVTILFCDWMREHGIVTWGDLFTYRRRARRMRAAIAAGLVACTCRTGRRTVEFTRRAYVPDMPVRVDVRDHKSVDCDFCSGIGAYLPNPGRTFLR